MELKNWLWDLIFINDYDVLAKKGPDAYHYLMFQSYIIRFLAIVTSVSIVIILPINMFGTESSSTSSFAQTTISNITSDSNLLWVHVACSLFLFAVSLWMMCHFSRAVNANANNYVKRTLLIQNVPKRMRVQAAVSEYFERIFPNIGIEGIQFVYNTKELRLLHSQFTASVNARTYCIEYNSSSAKRLAVPSCCLARCCCSGDGEDALNYYDKQIETLESRVTKEFYQTIGRPTGSMFITFKTPEMAKTVYQHLVELHEQSWAHFISARIFPTCPTLMKLTNGDEMMSDMWIVSKAPYPEDINWDDIGQDYRWLWFRKFFVHVILFLIFFFFSTPSIFLNTLSFIEVTQNLKKGVSAINPVFSEFVSPLMLVFFSTILPTCVTIACDYLPFKTFASKNRSVMWKVFSFLLLMVVILPSLGLTSAQALVVSAITNSTKTVECLFPVDNGAFFVNYVVQSTFVANAMELVRIPELFLYLYYYTFSIKSEAEFEKARRDINFDFQFGLRYPRFMLIFCLVITYSLACPMIAPFGMLFYRFT